MFKSDDKFLKLKSNRQEIHKFLTLLDGDIKSLFFDGNKSINTAYFDFNIIKDAIHFLVDCRLEYKERWYLRGIKLIIKKYEIKELYSYIKVINKKLNEHNIIKQKAIYYCHFRQMFVYDEVEMSKKGIKIEKGEIVYK